MMKSTLTNNTYLVDKEKSKYLKEFDKELSEGKIDKEIIPFLAKLNAIKGVCSMFSCSGHIHPEGSNLAEEGYIVLRLSKDKFNVLLENLQSILKRLKGYVTEFCINCCPWAEFGDHKPRIIFRWKIGYCSKIMRLLIKLLKDN